MRPLYSTVSIVFLTFLIFPTILSAGEKNGFSLLPSSIPVNEIYFGGPPRDGIPSLDSPSFHEAASNTFLRDDDRILGLAYQGEVKAYPIRILNWHEVVNDTFGAEQTPVVITYCPLCNTGAAFVAEAGGKKLQFGVSGLLYNSDVLLYDRQTESLWSQILARGVTGRYIDTRLQQLELTQTTWQQWKTMYPNSLVLSSETGFFRDYGRNPYQGYEKSEELFFPVAHLAQGDLPLKETILGVEVAGHFKAYPFSTLRQQGKAEFEDRIGGQSVTIRFDEKAFSATAHQSMAKSKGVDLSFIQGFWFAWYAFHPETEIFTLPQSDGM